MYTTQNCTILNVISKDYEMEGRKGTSNKIHILTNNYDNTKSVIHAKYDPTKLQFQPSEEVEITFRISESSNRLTLEAVSRD